MRVNDVYGFNNVRPRQFTEYIQKNGFAQQ